MLFSINRAKALVCCTGALGALAVAGCGSSSSGSSSGASTGSGGSASSSAASSSSKSAVSGGTIKIGVEMPTTGPLESLGVDTADAAKYAAAAVNAAGGVDGKKLTVVTYDTQLDPSTAASDFEQAATSGGIAAMIGPLISPEADAVLPVAARTTTVDIIPAAADDNITTPAKPYIYRTGSDESEDDASMAAEAKHLGCTKPALIYDNGTLGLSTKADIAKDIPHFVTSQEFSETATDLTPTLQAVKAAGATCIIEATDDLGVLGAMIGSMANTGYKIPVLGDSGTSTTTFVSAAGKALNQVPVYGSNSFNPAGATFKSDFSGFQKMFGFVPPQIEEIGTMWDAVHLIAVGLKKDGGKGGAALNSAMQEISGSDFTGIGGAAPGFSSSNHQWTTTATDQMYRIYPGPKLVPAKSAS